MIKNSLYKMHRNEIVSNIEKAVFFYKRERFYILFYVNNIVIAFKSNQRNNVDFDVKYLMKIFEIQDMSIIKFFLRVRII